MAKGIFGVVIDSPGTAALNPGPVGGTYLQGGCLLPGGRLHLVSEKCHPSSLCCSGAETMRNLCEALVFRVLTWVGAGRPGGQSSFYA